jgi:DNA-binding transcriptional MerR regulator
MPLPPGDHLERLTIGRFARLTDLSARTLRKYDALGLLRPAAVDPDTGYRLYRLDQVPRAETIRLLRSLDVPLAEIAAILDSGDPGDARSLLENQLARIERRIDGDRHTLVRLESALRRGGALDAYDCELKEAPAVPVIALRVRAPRERFDAVVTEAVARLLDCARRRRAQVAGREIVVYDFDPLEEDDYTADVCLPLSAAMPGDGDVAGLELGACLVAVTTHRGPDDDLRAAYCALAGWIVANGFEIAGGEREVYLVDERDTDDQREFVTEISWPVRRCDAERPAASPPARPC